MGDRGVHPPLVSLEHLAAAFLSESHARRPADKVLLLDLAVVEDTHRNGICNQRTELFLQVEGQGGPTVPDRMVDTEERIEACLEDCGQSVLGEERVAERKQRVHWVPRRPPVATGEIPIPRLA